MVVKHNKNNRTHFVYNKYGTVESFISTPFKNARKATKLTIRSGKTRLDLNGRQVRALRQVLAKAESLSSRD